MKDLLPGGEIHSLMLCIICDFREKRILYKYHLKLFACSFIVKCKHISKTTELLDKIKHSVKLIGTSVSH